MKAPTLYHGTTQKGLSQLFKENRFPKSFTGGKNLIANLTSSYDIAKIWATNSAEEARLFGLGGKEKSARTPVVVVFKPTAIDKAGFKPIRYVPSFFDHNKSVREHVFSQDKDEWGDLWSPDLSEEERLSNLEDVKKEQEWFSRKINEPIKPHIEKIIEV